MAPLPPQQPALAQVRHDIDSSVDFAVFAGDKLFGLKGGI
jgi:hypothetical protein